MEELIALVEEWKARRSEYAEHDKSYFWGCVVGLDTAIAGLSRLIASKKERPAQGVQSNG